MSMSFLIKHVGSSSCRGHYMLLGIIQHCTHLFSVSLLYFLNKSGNDGFTLCAIPWCVSTYMPDLREMASPSWSPSTPELKGYERSSHLKYMKDLVCLHDIYLFLLVWLIIIRYLGSHPLVSGPILSIVVDIVTSVAVTIYGSSLQSLLWTLILHGYTDGGPVWTFYLYISFCEH